MKIIKNKRLLEAVEDDAELKTASKDEIADDIQAGAEEADKFVEEEDAEEEAEVVKNLASIIRNPYGTGRLSDVDKVLQRALENAMDTIEDGVVEKGAFPNVLIYGLAGFGKTAKVKAFCRKHNLNLFECDAKSLDIATVGGIPYPVTDPKTGEVTQSPIGSRYWDGLNKPNTVLYLDELNRTGPAIRGSLLTLINEHTLPMTIKDPKTGEIKNVKEYPNILFTVVSINPADDIFQDNEDLDPAMISRHVAVIEQGPDIRDFLAHLTEVYTAIENNMYLRPERKVKYMGQFELAKAILTDPSFTKGGFDDADDVRAIYYDKTRIGNYLNYRSFYSVLRNCDGTKKDYLEALSFSGISKTKVTLIKNILSTYTDKVTVGNMLFNQNASSVRTKKAAQEVAAALAQLEKELE
jgi:hypothetical protein